jgi:putative nucleotidyltransferase with HDIG domain
MNNYVELCPKPPLWSVDWDRLITYQWIRDLAVCPQDAVHHGEGDVWTHTKMVSRYLLDMVKWRAASEVDQQILFLASLLHDVGKPARTRVEDGRITSRGHSRRGSMMARVILWRMGMPIYARERVAAFVLYHQAPFFLLERQDCQRRLFEISLATRCDHLAMLAEADARGRICSDTSKLLDNISLFSEYASEQECLEHPRTFTSDHSRFQYFRNSERDANYHAYDDTCCDVVLMSGLPGSGKDTWVDRNLPSWPVVSLDKLRAEMGISHNEPQGPVISRAREKARELLRNRRSFVWNGTNLSRKVRDKCIDLFVSYKARVRVVYVESPAEQLQERNRNRPAPVPEKVMEKLFDIWEVPARTEADNVDWITNE